MTPPRLICPEFNQISGISHGFFGRAGGVSKGQYASLNLGVGSDDIPGDVAENRSRVKTYIGASKLISVYQHHSAEVVEITANYAETDRPKADAMVTSLSGVGLCILTADCVPVLFADAEAGVIGAAHAGWRGALSGVCEATLDKMVHMGATAPTVKAVIGPAIHQKNYQVDSAFRDTFCEAHAWAETLFHPDGPAHYRFDITQYISRRLAIWGVKAPNISDVAVDVFAQSNAYFSNRHRLTLGLNDFGRNGSVICRD